MVRFAVENKTLSALNIRESDFWQPGTRAVMFSQPASQLLAGARMDVYVIRDGRATDGQYQYRCETQAVPVAGDCGCPVQPPRLVGHCICLMWTCPVTVKPWLNRSLCRI